MKHFVLAVLAIFAITPFAGCKKKDKKRGSPDFSELCDRSYQKMKQCLPDMLRARGKTKQQEHAECVSLVTDGYKNDRPRFDRTVGCLELKKCDDFVKCIMKNSVKRRDATPK
ncbi:hypothetical protein KKF84_05195 [Myxococcota bacterium]|nr:hypothetical protein [Myxococcota bacterium]